MTKNNEIISIMETINKIEFCGYGDAFLASDYYRKFGIEHLQCTVTKEYNYPEGNNPMLLQLDGISNIDGRILHKRLWPNTIQSYELKNALIGFNTFEAIIFFSIYTDPNSGQTTYARDPLWIGWADTNGYHLFGGEPMPIRRR